MTILETAILFKGNSLCEEHFYSSEGILKDDDRNILIKTIGVLKRASSYDKIHKFSMGDHKILIKLKNLEMTDENTKEKTNDPLVIYCVAGKKTEQNHIERCMDDSITQFLEQFSIKDITTKDPSKFKKFSKQLKKIFHEIALKPEDRFKSILF